MGKLWAGILVLILLPAMAGCQTGTGMQETVDMELDQDTGQGSPVEGDGRNCLTLTPNEDTRLQSLEAELSWDGPPDRLRLLAFHVTGGQVLDTAQGTSPLTASVQAGFEPGEKVVLAVLLPEDSQATAQDLALELTYAVEHDGPAPETGLASCEP